MKLIKCRLRLTINISNTSEYYNDLQADFVTVPDIGHTIYIPFDESYPKFGEKFYIIDNIHWDLANPLPVIYASEYNCGQIQEIKHA